MVKKEFMKENELLDMIKDEFRLKNDRELAEFLEVQPSMVSKLRNGKTPFTAHQILLIHDATDWSIAKIRSYLPSNSAKE